VRAAAVARLLDDQRGVERLALEASNRRSTRPGRAIAPGTRAGFRHRCLSPARAFPARCLVSTSAQHTKKQRRSATPKLRPQELYSADSITSRTTARN